MADPTPRRRRVARQATVVRTDAVTPHLVRVVLGGEGLTGFVPVHTDSYVKLVLPPRGAPYTAPFDPDAVQAEQPREFWPCTRTYTVRRWDDAAGELTIDVVTHGDEGLAGPWASAARPGDTVVLFGPGGAYTPGPDVDWHLFVGDETTLPAIAASLERLPAQARALAFVEVADAGEEQQLSLPEGAELTWVHRGNRAPGTALVAAVLSAPLPEGTVQTFVHGEAGAVRDLRRWLRGTLAVPREQLSVSGYWRIGRTEDRWQAEKPEWNAAVEAEEQSLSA
jgi:NADPH-dependent ferric siderophore reductase